MLPIPEAFLRADYAQPPRELRVYGAKAIIEFALSHFCNPRQRRSRYACARDWRN